MTDNPAGRQAGGEGFRVGARRVREEAQERLRKLRVARMKPRAPDAPVLPVDVLPEPVPPAATDAAPMASPDVAALEPAAAPAPRPKRKRAKSAAVAPAAPDLPAEQPGMTVSHAASEVARRAADVRPATAAPPPDCARSDAEAPTPVSHDDPAPPGADGAAAGAIDRTSPGGARPDDVPSDLAALPGAGPGLIWLFGRAGVTSMSDLARADAADLGARLGLVGELLDLSGWIDMARRHGEPTPAP